MYAWGFDSVNDYTNRMYNMCIYNVIMAKYNLVKLH